MATTSKTLLTAEEFMNLDLGEGTFELVKGEVVEVPPARLEHGIVCGNVYFALSSFGRATGYGYASTNDSAVVTERGPDTVRGADVCFYSYARLPRSEVTADLPPVVPDLVVEVYSPSNQPGKMLVKVVEYLNAGVPMVWVVNPERRNVTIYRNGDPVPTVLGDGDTIENLAELPGFRCAVADFFA